MRPPQYHSDGPAAIQHYPRRGRPGVQAWTVLLGQRAKKSAGRRESESATLIDLTPCDSQLRTPVGIGVALVSGLSRRLDERVVDLVMVPAPGDRYRTGISPVLVGTANPVLDGLEVR